MSDLLENKDPVLRTDPASVAYFAYFLTRKDVAQQHLESTWKPKNKKIKWRLLQTPHRLHGRLRAEMEQKGLKPISWTSFWKVVCQSGNYEVLTADNCCCSTCRDLGFYNFKTYNDLLDELERAMKKASEDIHVNRCNDDSSDVEQSKSEYSNYKKDISNKVDSLKVRIYKQVRFKPYTIFSFFFYLTCLFLFISIE